MCAEAARVANRCTKLSNSLSDCLSLNPYPLDFPHAHIIVAPVVKAGGLGVRMSGHALRDLDAPAVRQVVRDAGRAEGVAAYRGFDAHEINAAVADWEEYKRRKQER
jgi:hypothetical protein